MGVEVWIQKAPKLTAIDVICSCTHNSKLYGGTDTGELYEWNDVDAWVSKAPLYGSATSIVGIVSWGGNLYGLSNIGTLQKWNGTDAWTEEVTNDALDPTGTTANTLYAWTGGLYATLNYWFGQGALAFWNGTGDSWTILANPVGLGGEACMSLMAYGGSLYGGFFGYGWLKMYDGISGWVLKADNLGLGHTIGDMVVLDGVLYGSDSYIPNNALYKYSAGTWVQVAPSFLGGTTSITALIVYNNKIYAGTNGQYGGKLLEWNGVDAWAEVASEYNGEIIISSLVSYNSLLYGTTGTNGNLLLWNYAIPNIYAADLLGYFMISNGAAPGNPYILKEMLYYGIPNPYPWM